jgi:hypothetical protein
VFRYSQAIEISLARGTAPESDKQMSKSAKKKSPETLEALLEKTAKTLNRAAVACRILEGGEACLEMDYRAAELRNSKVMKDRTAAGRGSTKVGSTLTGMPPAVDPIKAPVAAPAANEPMSEPAAPVLSVTPAVEPAPARDPAVQG